MNEEPIKETEETQETEMIGDEAYQIKSEGTMTTIGTGGAKRNIKNKGEMELIPWDTIHELFIYSLTMSPHNFIKEDPDYEKDVMDMILNAIKHESYEDVVVYITCIKYGNGSTSSFTEALPLMLLDLGKQFQLGGRMYGKRNCQKGLSEWSYKDSGIRHTLQWIEGLIDEPHWVAAIWNYVMLMWSKNHLPLTQEEIDDEFSGKNDHADVNK